MMSPTQAQRRAIPPILTATPGRRLQNEDDGTMKKPFNPKSNRDDSKDLGAYAYGTLLSPQSTMKVKKEGENEDGTGKRPPSDIYEELYGTYGSQGDNKGAQDEEEELTGVSDGVLDDSYDDEAEVSPEPPRSGGGSYGNSPQQPGYSSKDNKQLENSYDDEAEVSPEPPRSGGGFYGNNQQQPSYSTKEQAYSRGGPGRAPSNYQQQQSNSSRPAFFPPPPPSIPFSQSQPTPRGPPSSSSSQQAYPPLPMTPASGGTSYRGRNLIEECESLEDLVLLWSILQDALPKEIGRLKREYENRRWPVQEAIAKRSGG
jgi:hypothetical protein